MDNLHELILQESAASKAMENLENERGRTRKKIADLLCPFDIGETIVYKVFHGFAEGEVDTIYYCDNTNYMLMVKLKDGRRVSVSSRYHKLTKQGIKSNEK